MIGTVGTVSPRSVFLRRQNNTSCTQDVRKLTILSPTPSLLSTTYMVFIADVITHPATPPPRARHALIVYNRKATVLRDAYVTVHVAACRSRNDGHRDPSGPK